MEPTTQVVVIEEQKRRKGLFWVAGGAALALMVGGGTFALWSATDTFGGGTIYAGDLNVTKSAESIFYDISPDRQDTTAVLPGVKMTDIFVQGTFLSPTVAPYISPAGQYLGRNAQGVESWKPVPAAANGDVLGHKITTPSAWGMVPQDVVLGTVGADVTLRGDNLVGELQVKLGDSPGPVEIYICTVGAPVNGQWTWKMRTENLDGTGAYAGQPAGYQAAQIIAAVRAANDLPAAERDEALRNITDCERGLFGTDQTYFENETGGVHLGTVTPSKFIVGAPGTGALAPKVVNAGEPVLIAAPRHQQGEGMATGGPRYDPKVLVIGEHITPTAANGNTVPVQLLLTIVVGGFEDMGRLGVGAAIDLDLVFGGAADLTLRQVRDGQIPWATTP